MAVMTSTAMKSTGRAGMPYADTPLAQYIAKQIDIQVSLGKNQRLIAKEIGYGKPNMISMFKRGEARIPFGKIPALAKSLNVDPAYMFRLANSTTLAGSREGYRRNLRHSLE